MGDATFTVRCVVNHSHIWKTGETMPKAVEKMSLEEF